MSLSNTFCDLLLVVVVGAVIVDACATGSEDDGGCAIGPMRSKADVAKIVKIRRSLNITCGMNFKRMLFLLMLILALLLSSLLLVWKSEVDFFSFNDDDDDDDDVLWKGIICSEDDDDEHDDDNLLFETWNNVCWWNLGTFFVDGEEKASTNDMWKVQQSVTRAAAAAAFLVVVVLDVLLFIFYNYKLIFYCLLSMYCLL